MSIHKNIDHLLQKGPMKCPKCKLSMQNLGLMKNDTRDWFECKICNIWIMYDSTNIENKTFADNGEFKSHYTVQHWFDDHNITTFTNYTDGRSKIWIEDNKSGQIVLDTFFDSSNMTFVEIFNFGRNMSDRFHKIRCFS